MAILIQIGWEVLIKKFTTGFYIFAGETKSNGKIRNKKSTKKCTDLFETFFLMKIQRKNLLQNIR